jgi:class 3 adenylate cyclase
LIELSGRDHLPYIGENTDDIVGAIQEFATGSRPVAEPDRVLATVMFTDIVNSTKRASDLGDRRWRALLDRHDHLVRQEVSRSRGREVKTLGDGFLVTHDGPARAIRCAMALVETMRLIDLPIRAGLHTGEIEVKGHDIAGIAVHIAARIAARAEEGQVLVSSTVRDLVAGSELRFNDQGTHRLKGVPEEVRLFSVEQ